MLWKMKVSSRWKKGREKKAIEFLYISVLSRLSTNLFYPVAPINIARMRVVLFTRVGDRRSIEENYPRGIRS